MMRSRHCAAALATLAFFACSVLVPTAAGQDPAPGAPVQAPSSPSLPKSYPAAGELVWTKLAARAAPDPTARAVKIFHQFRSDYRRQIMYAAAEATATDERPGFRASVP